MAHNALAAREALLPGIMQSRIETIAGVTVLFLAGEIDVSCVPEVESRLSRVLTGGGDVAVLDLEHVSFVDLAGMDAILDFLPRAGRAGCHVSVVSAGAGVRRVFALTGNEGQLDPEASLVDVRIAASIEADAAAPDG